MSPAFTLLLVLMSFSLIMERYSADGLTCRDVGSDMIVTLNGLNDCDRPPIKNARFQKLIIEYRNDTRGFLEHNQFTTNNPLFQEEGAAIDILFRPSTKVPPQFCVEDAFFKDGFRALMLVQDGSDLPIKLNTLAIQLPPKCRISTSSNILQGFTSVNTIQLNAPDGHLLLKKDLLQALHHQPTVIAVQELEVLDVENLDQIASTQSLLKLRLENVKSVPEQALQLLLTHKIVVEVANETETSTVCQCEWILQLGENIAVQPTSLKSNMKCSSTSEDKLAGQTLLSASEFCQNSVQIVSTTIGLRPSSPSPIPSTTKPVENTSPKGIRSTAALIKVEQVAQSSTMVLTVIALAAVVCVVILAVCVGLACRRRSKSNRRSNDSMIKYGHIQNKEMEQRQQITENGYYLN